jgi:predicted ATPase
MKIEFNKITVFIGENLSQSVKFVETCDKDYLFVQFLEHQSSPTQQVIRFYELLKGMNRGEGGKLIFTTHSSYILNALTLAIKAKGIKNQNIVPKKSCINIEDVSIYELTENGIIRKLPTVDGLPSDDNYLNNHLAKSNQLFDQLLELEELSS